MKPILILSAFLVFARAKGAPPDLTYHPTKQDLTNWFLIQTNCVTFSYHITNASIWDRTNFVIDSHFKGTIQVGDKFYHLTTHTNIVKKTVTETNTTTEIVK